MSQEGLGQAERLRPALGYARPAKREGRPVLRGVLSLVAAVLGVALLALSFSFPVRQEMGWVDAVTGSTKEQTVWGLGYTFRPLFGFRPVLRPSPLEAWLAKREGTVQHDWRNVKGTYKTVWGGSVGHSHGTAPAIYPLRVEALDAFVRGSSDDELAAFVATMRNGTPDQQRAAVEVASEKVINSVGR